VRVLNVTGRDQRLTKGCPVAYCEPVFTVYGVIFAMKSEDYGRTDRVYQRIHTRGATDSPNPEETAPTKTGGNRQDARRHATT
jgi:hypothetical protein